jgi:hypothetical protein
VTTKKVGRAQFDETYLKKSFCGLKEDGTCGQTAARRILKCTVG